jgi:cytochrome c biogenesis protein CcmG, thiol:disulfide interchange protein DsbE
MVDERMSKPPAGAAGLPESVASAAAEGDAPQTELEREEGVRRSSPLIRVLRLAAGALVVSLLVLLVWALLHSSRGVGFVRQIAEGKRPPAPAFTLRVIWPHSETWPASAAGLLADGSLSLRELRGRPVVVNFFASWCVACKDEAPLLHAEAQAQAGKVLFLGVDVQDLTSDARNFARKYDVNFVAVRDGSNAIYSDYGLTGVPETYFIDARGRAVAHIPGEATRATLERGIASITSARRGGALPGGAHVKGP